MAESSARSVQTGKKPTTRTKSLTPDLNLKILQEAILRCQQSGIEAGVREYHEAGTHGIDIILLGVVLADGNLVLASDSKIASNDAGNVSADRRD